MSKDFALDKETHDLFITGNELQVVDVADQLEQNLKIRLQFFNAEWFLDINNGLPFYSDILVKNPNIPNVDSIIKAEILGTIGVLELLEYVSTFDASLRTYTVSFTVRTEFGQTDLAVSLFNN